MLHQCLWQNLILSAFANENKNYIDEQYATIQVLINQFSEILICGRWYNKLTQTRQLNQQIFYCLTDLVDGSPWKGLAKLTASWVSVWLVVSHLLLLSSQLPHFCHFSSIISIHSSSLNLGIFQQGLRGDNVFQSSSKTSQNWKDGDTQK